MDEFAQKAIAGGSVLAVIVGPVGALMLWRRMTFFGAAIAESAVLGVVAGFMAGISPLAGAALVCVAMAFFIEWLRNFRHLSDDTVIGVIGHAALAAALVLSALLPRLRVDLFAYLFGDILAITDVDIAWGSLGALVSLGVIGLIWRPLLLATAEPEIAAAEGVPVKFFGVVFSLLLASVVAMGLRMVGALLIVALLVMPAAAARPFSRTPLRMAVLASLIAAVSIGIGIFISFRYDVPAGPTIALVAAGFFLISLRWRRL
jgi:zinc transport system permease protein